MRIHSGEKPFTCTICGLSYRQSCHLKNHLRRSHTIEKRYKCNLCCKSFVTLGELKIHKRSHPIEEIFSTNDHLIEIQPKFHEEDYYSYIPNSNDDEAVEDVFDNMLNNDRPIDQNTNVTDAIFVKIENISSTNDHLLEIQPNTTSSTSI